MHKEQILKDMVALITYFTSLPIEQSRDKKIMNDIKNKSDIIRDAYMRLNIADKKWMDEKYENWWSINFYPKHKSKIDSLKGLTFVK